uniref:Fibronectin type-III domain-containing protein n=1 Tax=Neogobius melanostomus TaxID=47308 RepID=A0A8C6TL19_9GOBI
MGVIVYNISATSAKVSWPRSPDCLDTFYSVMYDPNWNSLLMGYKRKSFMHEERIPVSQTSTHLANLHPQTAYFLCVTCQAANPSSILPVFFTMSAYDKPNQSNQLDFLNKKPNISPQNM